MPTDSTHLKLQLYNNTSDFSGSFLSWVRDMSGSSNSNITKIDEFAGWSSGSITTLTSDISGSLAEINSLETSISGSLTTITSNLAELGLRLYTIDEFTGVGQADFNNIPQTYSHLIIMGTTQGNVSDASVIADFNGDANSDNYAITNWNTNLSGVVFNSITTGGALILGLTTSNTHTYYPGVFFSIIPNYAASGGFYKTLLSFSSFYTVSTASVGQFGGVWKQTSAITRIRIAAARGGYSTRYNFIAGTKISLYGFG